MKLPWTRVQSDWIPGALGKLVLLAYGVFKVWESSLDRLVAQMIFGGVIAAGALYWLTRTDWFSRRARARIAAEPHRVVWVYEATTRVHRGNVGSQTYRGIVIAFDDGKTTSWRTSRPLEHDAALVAAIQHQFPNATIGYSDAYKAAYTRAPQSLRRGAMAA